MSKIHESQTSSPIERILICHPSLPEKCLNGKSLSENAEIEEIAEQIFLYVSPPGAAEDPNNKNSNNNGWNRQAVQFLGLCVGLYTLPSSLKKDETTKSVYLGKSTLIFVPLEGELLAVIQMRRGGGNPLAVRQSIEKCHSLFEMFHGGGVLHRLKQQKRCHDDDISNNNNNNNKCIYPGLDQLYSLRKDIRKLKTKQSRLSTDAADDEHERLQHESDQLGCELEHLQQQLPNESIRQDLASHYNEYLDNLSLVTSRQGGGLRCLVDCVVPVPIAQDSGLHTLQSSPSRLSNELVPKLTTDLQHILVHEAHQPLLFGISTFYLGNLIQYDFFGNGSAGESHFSTCGITAETVTTIMGYMASYRIKLLQQKIAHGPGNKSVTSPLRLGNIASSLAYKDQAAQHEQPSIAAQQSMSLSGGSFLVPPPSFMMSGGGTEDEANQSSIAIESEQQIAWAPRLNLFINGGKSKAAEQQQTSKNARVLCYTIGDFSFLIFLHDEGDLDLQSDAGRDMVSNVLVSVRNKMDAAVMTTSQAMISSSSPSPYKDRQKPNLGEPGVDFILIDRKQHELTLFTDRKAVSSSPSSKKPQGNGASPRKRFGFMPPKIAVPSQGDKKAISQSLEWAVLGLDCRHRLASHLHLDVLLAFDDMMNDIATKFSRKNDDDSSAAATSSSSKYVELCTCMALGWVYGCANGDTELYAFFDNSTYVTVSDVQNAVKRIHNKVSQN